jgi:hypothetical protein
MAINNKDLLDMSPAFFAELTEVAITEKGLGGWTKLATGNSVDLEKLARATYLATNPLSRFVTSPTTHAVGGGLAGATALGGAGGALAGPVGAAVGAAGGAALYGGGRALGRLLESRALLGRIKKARRMGRHPFHFLTATEKKAIKVGKLKVPEKLMRRTTSPMNTPIGSLR